MRAGTWIIIAVLVGLLAATVVLTYATWQIGDGEAMSAPFVVAMVLGAVVTMAVGCGLMWLVYYSNRMGYDRPAELKRDDEE